MKRKRQAAALDGDVANEEPPDDGVGLESELKLDVRPEDAVKLLESPLFAQGKVATRDQQTVYFETPDRALRKKGFSLRVRRTGERRVQTLKAEGEAVAGLFVRPEWEREISGDAPIVDDSCGPLKSLIPTSELKRLRPIFQIEVTRTLTQLEHQGSSVEIVFDQGEVRVDGRTDRVCELELELKRGSSIALFSLAHELNRLAPVRSGVLAKSERGARLEGRIATRSSKAEPLVLRAGTSTAAGFQAIVGACLRHFRLNEVVLSQTGDPAALHQARVALRRLRSALSTCKAVVEDERYEHIRSELRWIATELGHARNLDVMLQRLDDDAVAEPLKAAQANAYASVQAALASARTLTLMIDLAEWSAIGAWTDDGRKANLRGEPIEQFAASALERHRRRLKRRGRDLSRLTDDGRHQARIEAKKLRYATEFFSGLFDGKKATRRQKSFREALEELREQLGNLNDVATAPAVLAQLELAETVSAGAMAADVAARRPLLEMAEDAYSTLIDVKRFWRT